jgi:hypothetical protein
MINVEKISRLNESLDDYQIKMNPIPTDSFSMIKVNHNEENSPENS